MHGFSWSRSSFTPASCPMWITLPSGSPDNVLGNAYNSYGVAYVCFIWSRSTDYGRSNCVWAVYLKSATLYEWVNTSNQFGVAADHFGGRGVFVIPTVVVYGFLSLMEAQITSTTMHSLPAELPV